VVGYGLVLMMLVRGLFAESFQTPSASMEPTLTPEDRILVNKIGGASSLQRGDLVVLDGTRTFADRAAGPGSDQSSVVGRIRGWIASPLLIHPNESDYVKRVVGLPGDHVVCCEARGPLTANDIAVEEPYLYPGDRPSGLTLMSRLRQREMWMMGGRRGDSADLRANLGDPGGGMVPLDDVIGRAGMICWPPGRVAMPNAPRSSGGIPATTGGERHR
jgi:signal peptidase I